jgi:hypothetical protein
MMETLATTRVALLSVRDRMVGYYEQHSKELFEENNAIKENNKLFLDRKELMMNNSRTKKRGRCDDDDDGYR